MLSNFMTGKTVVTVLVFFFALSAHAKKDSVRTVKSENNNKTVAVSAREVLLELKQAELGRGILFQLVKTTDGGGEKVILSKNDGEKSLGSIELTRSQLLSVQSEALELIWDNNYGRNPPSIDKCRSFAQLKVKKDKALICKENVKLVGRTSSLFYKLENLVTKK